MNRQVDHEHPRESGLSHDPNLITPAGDGAFDVWLGERNLRVTLANLAAMPQIEVQNCFIVSTGHGTSGPYRFGGVSLASLLLAHGAVLDGSSAVTIIGADNYSVSIPGGELCAPVETSTHLLATHRDGRLLSREQGLVRLIVPAETDDALLQLKWIHEIRVTAPTASQHP